MLHAGNDLFHRLARQRHQFLAGAHLLGGTVDQQLDLLGGRSRALRQVAHFAGHDGEATSLFACACRFHGRVQGQDIRLEGDAIDDGDDVADLFRRGIDGAHGLDHLAHHAARLAGHLRGRNSQLVGLARIVRILPHGRGHFFHGRSRFLQRTGLLLRARRQIMVAGSDLARCRGNRFRVGAHLAHQVRQVVAHGPDGHQQAGRVARTRLDVRGQVALGDLRDDGGSVVGLATELAQDAAQHQGRQAAHHQHQRTADGQQHARLGPELVVDVIDIRARADQPVPRRKFHHRIHLCHRVLHARTRAVRLHQADAAVGQRRTVAVARLLHVLLRRADARRIRVHVQQVRAEIAHEIIHFVLDETADGQLGLLLRLLTRELAGLFQRVRLFHRGIGQFHQHRQLLDPLGHHGLAQGIQGKRGDQDDAQQGAETQQKNARTKSHGNLE
ncbi:hypothetical protein D3C81_108090 [compost metagenome]